MKRRLFTLAIFLLLGAITNVAVAWGCALWSPLRTITLLEGDVVLSELRAYGFDPLELSSSGAESRVGLGWRWRFMVGYDLEGSSDRLNAIGIMSYETGCPMLCMTGHIELGPGLYEIGSFSLIDPPSDLGRVSIGAGRRLPTRPIWPGFAINTAFYAAILWLVIPGPFALRRHIRRKRGMCLACGYDLRGNPTHGCPECGWRRDAER